VRPVREQLEHDRVIRLLQAKYKRKFEVAINPGAEQTTPVGSGPSAWYPDLVLQSTDRARKLLGVVEVETAESVNNLEAMSQWAAFSRLRTPFHLYVPASAIDTTRRLCADLQLSVAEIWAYHTPGDQLRFTLVQRAPQPSDGKVRAGGVTRPAAAAPRPPAARPPTARRPAAAPPRASRTSAARGTAGATAMRRTSAAKKTKPAGRRTLGEGGSRVAARKKTSNSPRAQKRK
jgi:hypothetical protein